jgi:hypothetical protein
MAAVKKKKEEAPKGGFGKFVFGLLFVVIVVGGSFILWQNYQLKANASENVAEDMGEQGSDTLSEGDIVDLIAKVSKHIIVPSDEEPTIATIVDAEKLSQDQAFYSNVKDGDKVLIYMNAQKALIYRESEDLLVNVGPVYTNESEEEVLPEEEIIEEPAIEQSEEPMTIEIRNGSKTAGVAGDLKDKLLENAGYDVIDIGDADNKDYEGYTIVNLTTGNKELQLNSLLSDMGIADALTELPEGVEETEAEILIIIGA